MTVSSSTDRDTFAGNGVTTVFPLSFRFFNNADISAQLIDDVTGAVEDLTLGIGYTLSGAGDPEVDGSATSVLTTTVPVAVGVSLFVLRTIPLTQPTDIINQGRFFPETHEAVFDRLTMIAQQTAGAAARTLRVQPYDPEPARLPGVGLRVGKLLSFDENGDPIAVAPADQSATALALLLAASGGSALIGHLTGTVADYLISGQRDLRSFGVVGDGVTDDTIAMAQVFAYSGVVIGAPDMVVLTDSQTITGSLVLDMRGGQIKQRTALMRITVNAQGVEFRNAVFDGNMLNVNVCFFRIPATYNNWAFENCRFQNIAGIAGSANQYGIYADLDSAVGRVSHCTFQNISNVSNGTPTSAFCGAMLLAAGTAGCADVRIESVTVIDVFCTGIAGNVNNSDADGIRVFGPQPTVQSNLHITSLTCIDVQKSGIKVSGNRGLNVNGVTVYNDRSDIGMVAGVRFQAADYSTISNINLIGRMSVGINIRSRNIIISGVNYRPIDTARDTVPSGLIQLQSDDTYVTQHVMVSNVVGRNVAQAFDFDLTGVSIAQAFLFIEFHHWDIFATNGLSSGTPARIQKTSHINLDHVKLWDATGAWVNAITCNGASNFKAHYCRIEARRELFTWAPGDNGIEFDGCSFFRPDAFSNENFRMLLMRDTSSGALDRVTIRNCTFSCPAYSVIGNQQCIFLNATNAVVDGVSIYVRANGANVSPPAGWIGLQGSGYKVSDVRVGSEAALTNGSGGYAVDLSASATGSVVTDIMNTAGPGVRASAGGDNNLIDTVAGKVTAVANSGTGNTVGSTHVLP